MTKASSICLLEVGQVNLTDISASWTQMLPSYWRLIFIVMAKFACCSLNSSKLPLAFL